MESPGGLGIRKKASSGRGSKSVDFDHSGGPGTSTKAGAAGEGVEVNGRAV